MPATSGYTAAIESNTVDVSYVPEVTWGVLPSAQFTSLRLTGESLSGQKQRQRPQEMGVTRQAASSVTTQESAGGTLNFAMSYGTFDGILAGAVGEDWTAALAIDGVAGDISTVATGNKLTSTTAGKFSTIVVGQNIRLHGFTTANTGIYRVSAKTSNQDITLAGKTVTNETPTGTNAKVRGSMLRNDVDFQSFYFQKKLASALWLRYPGAYFGSFSLSWRLGQFFGGTATIIAKEEMKSTSDASTGAIIAANTNRVMDTVSNFKNLQLDDAAIGAVITGIDLNLSNDGAAADYGLGSAAAQGMRGGTFTPGGSLSALFRDFTLYDLFKSEVAGRLSWETWDTAGNAYKWTLLSANIMNPSITAGGLNQPVGSNFSLEGNVDPTIGKMLQVDRFPSAA